MVLEERPWDSIVPNNLTLERNEKSYAKEQLGELKNTPCRWSDEVLPE